MLRILGGRRPTTRFWVPFLGTWSPFSSFQCPFLSFRCPFPSLGLRFPISYGRKSILDELFMDLDRIVGRFYMYFFILIASLFRGRLLVVF